MASEPRKWERPKMFLMLLTDETMSYKETQKLLLRLSGNGRYLTLKSSNIWIYQNVSQHTHLFASVDWQAVNQTDWHSFLGFTNGLSIRVYTLKAISQIQLYWELHIFCPIWSNFYGKGVINWGGWSISPLKDPKHKQVCLFLFWGRPFKLVKFHGNRRGGM